MPWTSPSWSTVMTVTPVAKHPIALRKSFALTLIVVRNHSRNHFALDLLFCVAAGLLVCRAAALLRSASSGCADAGAPTFPSRTISLALNSFPYRALLAPSSERMVEPSSDNPANNPFDREYDRISAFMTISVSAEAARPTGPAAADAYAPFFTDG